jgi:hypothetical protein
MTRYAAKLLLIWDPDPITNRRDRRYCEERIVLFTSRSAAYAVRKAKAMGRDAEVTYDSGHRLRFAGVLECMRMEAIFHGPGEVWYEWHRRVNPEKWARTALPAESALNVFKEERLIAKARQKPKASRNRR